MDKFLQIYGTLPRAGPGSNALTRRAYRMISAMPDTPYILDVGCGPGMQTIELLRVSGGTVVALDVLPEMIDRVRGAAQAAQVTDRLVTLQRDMHEMDFAPSSFDIVWSEGAIYLAGFARGLSMFSELVKPGGYIAVSDAVWLKPNPPPEAVEFWREYPGIDTVRAKLDIVRRTGLEPVGSFVFPSSAWTTSYYAPMERRIAEKAQEWKGDPEGEAVLEEASKEISIFSTCSAYYGYAFFVMRKPGASRVEPPDPDL